MKKKLFFGIVLMVFLVIMLFNGIPVKAGGWDGAIKIGALGRMQSIQGMGIEEGCHLAAEQINLGPNGVDDGGDGDDGIVIGGLNYKITIVMGDTSPIIDPHAPPDPEWWLAVSGLVAAGCDFVVGSDSQENNTFRAQEVLMDYNKMFFITGDFTNELIDCGTGTCGKCVRCDYDRYKYVFRNTQNSTTLLYSTANFAAYVMQTKLIPVFGTPVKIAVISEASIWADKIHANLRNSDFWSSEFGLPVSVVYTARVSPTTTDVTAELTGVKASGARLLIHVISGPSGRTLATQFADLGVNALLAGIDVPGQEVPLHWLATGGKCEYEALFATCGQETPIWPRTLAYYNAYVAEYGHAPLYTSYSAYDAVIAIEQVIEAAGTWPLTSIQKMVPSFESLVRDGSETMWDYSLGDYHPNVGILGKFKYTQYHDLFCNELGATWEQGYVRPLVAQWQAGRLEVVWPKDKPYTKEYKIPPWMPPPPPEYTLRLYSSPTTVTFTVDGVSRTTPWSGIYSEGASVSLVMPETHNGCVWSHWLEDGDTNRTKTITMDTNITLTAVFACTFDVVLDDIHYPISILSNSTVSNFNFNQTEMQISFNVTGESGTTGYCNITIPKSLLTGNPWKIKIDNTPITDFDEKTNDTHTFLYFTYTHESPLQVTIEGKWVVPEFPSAIILPLFMILSLITVVSVKLKKKKQ